MVLWYSAMIFRCLMTGFRDRIMFPIPDSKGRIIAFGGRAMAKDVPAKY